MAWWLNAGRGGGCGWLSCLGCSNKANVFDMLAALADEAGEAARTLLPRL